MKCKTCGISLEDGALIEVCSICESILKIQTKVKRVEEKKFLRHNINKEVKLICSSCKIATFVTTNQPAIYTDEVKAKWTCLKCSPWNKKVPIQEGEPNG